MITIIAIGGSLKGIRLSWCKWVQCDEYFETFLKSCSGSLLELDLYGCQSLLPFPTPQLPQQLEANSNSNGITDTNTHSESTTNPPIGLMDSTNNIDDNNNENSNSTSTTNNSNSNRIPHTLEYLPSSLVSINLTTPNPCLNDGLVRYLAKRCPLLQRVEIWGCEDLSNEALLALR